MTNETQTSSLNLLLIISAVVLVGLGITWLGFDHFGQEEQPPATIAAVVERPPVAREAALDAVISEGFDVHLNKAQLAIEANMVFEPAGQNALYFIGLVLGEEPDHPAANEALDSISDSLAGSVRQAIESDDLVRANRIAQMVDGLRPNHPLVFEVQDAQKRYIDGQFAAAWEYADKGEREEALALIAEVSNLPGADIDRVSAMRAEVDARHREFEAAATATRQRQSREEAAANTLSEWRANADAALETGRFTEPAEDNALFFLSEIDSNDPEAVAYKERLHNAVLEAVALNIQEIQFEEAEALLATAAQTGVSPERIEASQSALDRAFANNEATKIIPTGELVWRQRVAPVYPRSAERRGTEGQVEIIFTVTTSGETADVEVIASNPGETFDLAAIQAVQQWQFEPHTIRGIAVNQRSGALVRFSLN